MKTLFKAAFCCILSLSFFGSASAASLGNYSVFPRDYSVNRYVERMENNLSAAERCEAIQSLASNFCGVNIREVIDILLCRMSIEDEKSDDVRTTAIQSLTWLSISFDFDKRRIVTALLFCIKRDSSARVRAEAIKLLASIAVRGDKPVTSLLVDCLSWDRDSSVRQEAIGALCKAAEHGDKVVVDALIKSIKSNDEKIRFSAACALRCLALKGDKDAIAVIKDRMGNDESSSVRSVVLGSYVILDEFFTDLLIDRLQNDTDWSVRITAVGLFRDHFSRIQGSNVGVLVDCIKSDPNYHVRDMGIESLVEIAKKSDEVSDKDVITVLSNCLKNDKNSFVRWRSATFLKEIVRSEDREAMSALIDRMKRDEDSDVRDIALQSLVTISRKVDRKTFCGAVCDILFWQNDLKRYEKDDIARWLRFESFDDMLIQSKKALSLARKKHPLSRLALGLGIKSGKKRAGGAGAGAGAY